MLRLLWARAGVVLVRRTANGPSDANLYYACSTNRAADNRRDGRPAQQRRPEPDGVCAVVASSSESHQTAPASTGAACREAEPAFRRVDLEILGNGDPFVHADVWPRYEW